MYTHLEVHVVLVRSERVEALTQQRSLQRNLRLCCTRPVFRRTEALCAGLCATSHACVCVCTYMCVYRPEEARVSVFHVCVLS